MEVTAAIAIAMAFVTPVAVLANSELTLQIQPEMSILPAGVIDTRTLIGTSTGIKEGS